MQHKIKFTQVKSDIFGNPRYVCHFLELITEQDEKKVNNDIYFTSNLYNIAVNKAKKIGGKRYTGKDYGGGIVFFTYEPLILEEKIKSIL